ncbi:MAG: UbiX family flavin prenyltransferase [Peptococcaceae bacterium]|nr:UbiX family flavin prenyltransferase [Peptococcaceae bacterium]MDH7525083.1 UbiX family flavin prenyltransferase [Peptococcaceae bacterium]
MKLVVAITGASGAIYGIRVLEQLKQKGVETHLVITEWGREIIEQETRYTVEEVRALADYNYDEKNLAARISSGSFRCDGMIVVPCSMKTLSGIASGYAEDLPTRAADVMLKEQRKLVLIVRETPLNAVHLENMLKLARLGVVIMPPVPAFYTRPKDLDEVIHQTVGRALDQFGIEIENLKRYLQ